MSSAILFLAIIAIWAGVLIPRWLRHDPARGGALPEDYPAAPGDQDVPGTDADPDIDEDAADLESAAADDPPRPARAPLSSGESRRRMLAARRRLLGMLVLLEAAAITLTVFQLAAIWVAIPPTAMLAGYLLLLREAAHADAEQAQREAEAAASARARERARREHAATAAARAAAVSPASTGTGAAEAAAPATAAAALAAKFAAAPVPEDYEDQAPGRDFAPGLAGKYTTSYADAGPGDEDDDGYEQPRLRAVGD